MADKLKKTVVESCSEQSYFEDEAFETIWELREQGEPVLDDMIAILGHPDKIKQMQADGLIAVEDGVVQFSQATERRARDIIRRHRLAERLFADVLDIKDFEADACRIEHAISPEVEEAICTLLGHPPLCPHGKAIPKGNCCKTFTRKVKPLVQSLADAELGKKAKVLFISVPSIDRLSSMGLVPGAEIVLSQKNPSYVLEIDHTTIAIDEEIAKGIYVKQA